MTEPTPFPAIEDLIPHRGTMLLLDRVLSHAGDLTQAEYAPQAHAWYADAQGRMPAWIGIELMAQTIAAHVGLVERGSSQPPQLGVLLGTRAYRSQVASFAPQQPLCIGASKLFSDASGLSAYHCTISCGSAQDPSNGAPELASATLKVFETNNVQSFAERGIE